MVAIPSADLNILDKPYVKSSTTGAFALTTTRPVALINSSNPAHTCTVPSGASRLVVNTSTLNKLAVSSTGQSVRNLRPGESILVSWDSAAAKHELHMFGTAQMDVGPSNGSVQPAESGGIKAQLDALEAQITSGGASVAYVDAEVAGGQILLIRDGAVQSNYASAAVTKEDFGDALATALAALMAGDTLRLRGFEAEGTGWTVTQSDVKIVARDVTLIPSGNYNALFQIDGADTEVEGLILDGKTLANTLDGEGFHISSTAHRCRLRNVEAHRTRGGVSQNPSTIIIGACEDFFMDGFRSINAGYAGVRFVNTVRATVQNVYVEDPINRAMNIEGSGQMECIRLINWVGKYLNPVGQAGVFSNCNIQGCLERLEIDNYDMFNDDVHGSGNSYDDPSSLQMFKCHGVRRGYFKRMRLYHGDNVQAVGAPSFRVPGPGEGVNPEELHFEDCEFASHIKMPPNPNCVIKKVTLRRCHVGSRMCTGTGPIDDLACEEFDAEGCTFNSHDKQTVIDISTGQRSFHRIRFVRNRVLANSGSQVYVFNGSLALAIRGGIGNYEVHSNELFNQGSSTINIGNGSRSGLAFSTDDAGALLFDGNAALGTSTGQMPDPGSGPAFFAGGSATTTLEVPIRGGVKIWNTAFTSTVTTGLKSIRGWISASTTPLACTFNADDTVSATAHGFSDNDCVFFRLGSLNTKFLATFALTDVVTATGHTFVDGDVVEFLIGYNGVMPITADPSYIRPNVPYWVRDVSGDTFKLAASAGGAAIDITTTGAGNIYVRRRELPSVLEPNLQYFVRDSAANTFKLTTTFGGASALDIVDTGSGGSPKVVRMQWHEMPRDIHGTAAPTSGTWRAGDIVWNSAPAVASPIGWMCTVAGTPGTWVAMANL